MWFFSGMALIGDGVLQAIFLTVLLVKFVIEDGRTHWLNGVTLVCVYIMLATTFWHFPTK
jgi:Ca2+/H+ antiporter